jgi:hypothetical protein
VLTHLDEGAEDLDTSVSSFGNSLGSINSLLNELAYNPKGRKESFLFYLPWLNHNLNATFNLADAGGPISRAVLMLSCNGSYLGYGLIPNKPYLQTLTQGTRIPRPEEIPVPENPSGHCEFKTK